MTVAILAGCLIACFEGCRLEAYQDIRGIWTVGFGHTGEIWPGQPVGKGTTITMEEALELLEQDSKPLLRTVLDKPVLEAAALVSFGYNCGLGALQRVLDGKAQVNEFNHVNGVVNDALTRRRALESALIEVSRGQ